FVANAGATLVVVQRSVALPWVCEDWRAESDVEARVAAFLADDRARGIDASRTPLFLADDRARGIDASRTPLMRVALLRTDDARWTLVWTQHHLLLDRWSWPIV